ncbi:MAG: hypothetical protein M3Y25_03580 [Thermoproteota archaeon]|nr:hypothetical protein [Thermoproteota archaeon]
MVQEDRKKEKSICGESFAIKSVVPAEIDTHFQLYGKHMWEVSYTEQCPRCEKMIDEFGYCACNGFAE